MKSLIGYGERRQQNVVKAMRAHIPSGAPTEAKIQILGRLHDQVMNEEMKEKTHPSASLQLGIATRVGAHLKQVGGSDFTGLSTVATAVRSALIMSSAPGLEDEDSWREYSSFTGVNRESVALHVGQRDAKDVIAEGGNTYKLVRQEIEDPVMREYEVNGRAYLLKVADPRNLGSMKQNKVNCSVVLKLLTPGCLLHL